MNRKQLIAALAVIAVVCAACAAVIMVRGGDGETVVVSVDADSAPFSYRTDGGLAGIDVDLIRAAGGYMGVTIEFREGDRASTLESVRDGGAQIGCAGFYLGEFDGSAVVSDVLRDNTLVVVAPSGSGISSSDDLAALTVSVRTDSAAAIYAEGVTAGSVSRASNSEAVLDVVAGRADCAIMEAEAAAACGAEASGLEILNILEQRADWGSVLVFSDEGLRDRFDAALARIQGNGIYNFVMNHYGENGYSPDTPSFHSTSRTLVVETNPDFPPFDYTYGTEFSGIDMDILRAVCYDLNVGLEFRQNSFDSIILSVSQGKCDMGASGFTISEERRQQVLFSDPYAEIRQVVVVKEGSGIQTLDDVRGKRISVQTGTSGADYAATISNDVIYQKTYSDVVLDVTTGKSDCEIVDSAVAYAQAARISGLKVLDILDCEPEYYGFVFSFANQGLCDMVNASLAKLTEDGTIDRINAYYFDHGYAEVPSYYSTQEAAEDEEGGGGFFSDLWNRFSNDFIKNDRYNYIFTGLKNTLIIAAIALVIGLVLGAMVAMVRSTHDQTGKLRILNAACVLYTTVIRGTPVMVQLLIIYYVIFASSSMNSVMIAAVAFGVNSGAYVAEVIRGGINAVPKGQMEACRSLGMSQRMGMTKVVMPQAVRNILPALGNESISLLKETSIAGYIGVMDLTRGADIIRGQTYDALLPMLMAAGIYLAIVLVMTYLVGRMERRLNDAY